MSERRIDDLERRVTVLEKRVQTLLTGLHLSLVAAAPTAKWIDDTMAAIAAEKGGPDAPGPDPDQPHEG